MLQKCAGDSETKFSEPVSHPTFIEYTINTHGHIFILTLTN